MKFSVSRWCVLVVLAGLILRGVYSHAKTLLPSGNNKVIIYPTGGETIDQLRQKGFTRVRNYGSYWLVEATDAQVDELTHLYGGRAVENNRFNRIELGAASFDTTAGEPSVPPQLRQTEGKGERLRLVQFRGPIVPEWLRLITSQGAQVVSYIPNNAYLVLLDQAAENKLRAEQGTDSPIQWIGSYHPFYKISHALLNASEKSKNALVDVQIAMVGGSEAKRTTAALEKFGLIQSSFRATRDERVARMTVPLSDIPRIARLEGVLWIEKVERKVLLDEVQDLIEAEQTSGQPGYGPTNMISGTRFTNYLGGVSALFTNYLDFLTNTVGGGLASFLQPTNYPIVDVADTGLDVDGFVQPSFAGRVAYIEPPNAGYFDGATVDSGCAALNLNFIGTEDFYDHGTRVASVIVGYDEQANETNVMSIYSTIETQFFSYTSICGGTNSQTNTFTFATSPCPLTTGLVVNCLAIGQPISTNLALPTEVLVTNFVNLANQDPSGFHLGLGVSPFGLIGSSRIWHQAADTTGTPPHARLLPNPQPTLPCMEGNYPSLFFHAYTLGARIQNNSWSEDITFEGLYGGRYDVDAQVYDTAVRDALLVGDSNNVPTPFPLNQEFIIVFAGLSIRGDIGVAGGVGGIGDMRITPPATAKNVITVCSSESVRLDGSSCGDADDSQKMYELSEFGPTLEGRIKPEIVAPATSVWAAKSLLAVAIDPVLGIIPVINEDPNGFLGGGTIFDSVFTNLYCSGGVTNTCSLPCPFYAFFTNTTVQPAVEGVSDSIAAPGPIGSLYDCDSGSSYAAPEVSGAIQLLWWYFQHRLTNELGNALLQPSPAMAKAYLCNSARYLPIQNPQQPGTLDTLPSIAQGMGELDLATMFDGVPRAIRDESSPRAIDTPLIATNPAPQQTYFSQSGQSYEVSGQIASNGLPFRVTVAWIDPPGNPAASVTNQLVNDLGLQVTIGAGTNQLTFNGNQFSANVSAASTRIDTINNLLSVFLNPTNLLNGIAGVSNGAPFQVVVRAQNIAAQGVPNVGEPTPGGSNTLNQDFAMVIYNAATNTLSDVPNVTTNNACQTAMPITQFPFTFTNNLTKAVYRNVQPSPTAGRGGVDEFFKIQLPTPGVTFTINTAGTTFPALLSVWEVKVVPEAILVRSDCGVLTEVVSTNSLPAQVSLTSDGSNDYYIVVEPQNDGPGGQMVLNVNASAVPITITPSSLTFGSQVAGTVSTQQVVTYANGTIVPVSVGTVSITGSNAADFTIVNDGCQNALLNPGNNCSVGVAFAPATNDVGTLQANLVFTDDQVGSPRSIPLTGFSTAPAPLVCLSTNGTLTFSSQLVGTTSTVQSVTLTNCGSTPLTVSSVTISGTESNDFSVTQTCTNAPIAVDGTCTLQVTFRPSQNGNRQATLVITHDAAGSPTTLALQGVGVAPVPSICLSSSSMNFGGVVVGSTGAVQSLTITNCGTAPLVISNIAITAGNTGDFIKASSTSATVATGGTYTVNLQFAPTVGGARSATLSIISSNNIVPPQLVSLSGTGALSQPDAAIGKTFNKLKKFVGFGVINTTGVGQEIVQNVHRQTPEVIQKDLQKGKHGQRYYVAVKNDGSGPDQFTVQGTQISGGQGWTVNYYLGATPSDCDSPVCDVTTAVLAGTYTTSAMEAGAVTDDSTMIRAEVFADKTLVKKGTQATFTLTFTSVNDTTQQDTVWITAVGK